MKINVTKKEYRLLLDMLCLSDWVMNARAVEPDEFYNDHQAFKKKCLSYYKEMEAEDIIEYAKGLDDHFELREYDEFIHNEFIEPYESEVFWEALIHRLAERDLIKEIGAESFQALDGIERVTQLEKISERYVNEFEEHGLKHIELNYKESTIN